MPRKSSPRSPKVLDEFIIKNPRFLILVDDACAFGATTVKYNRYMAYLEFRYYETDNPCFLWEAISETELRAINETVISLAGSLEEFRELGRDEQVKLKTKAIRVIREAGVHMPGWCTDHLAKWAGVIIITSQRIHSRTFTEKLLVNTNEALNWARRPSITNEQAADQVASALEFTKPGWNAFGDIQGEHAALNVEWLFERRRLAGSSATKAYIAVADELTLAERSVQRLVAQGRKIIRELESFMNGERDKT